jgi:hypothetical protein
MHTKNGYSQPEIFDVVFFDGKRQGAKFFIGTLLEQNIESIEIKPQEFTYVDELAGLGEGRENRSINAQF